MRCRLLIIVMISFFSAHINGQDTAVNEQNVLQISTYPIRYIYGPNFQLTALFRNNQQLTLHYQFHQRDFFSVRHSDDVLGLTAIPRLLSADGYTLYASYLFPTKTDQTWLGPKVGLKMVDGFTGENEEYPQLINQRNLYALLNWVYRTKNKGLFFELYSHAGVVLVKRQETEFRNNQAYYFEDYPLYVLPHFLVGFSVGFGL